MTFMGKMIRAENYNLPLGVPEVKRDSLEQVLDELTGEEDREEAVGEAFFWRAIFLYNNKLGIEMTPEEAEEFYKKIKPVMVEMLKEKGRKYQPEAAGQKGNNSAEAARFKRFTEHQEQRPDLY